MHCYIGACCRCRSLDLYNLFGRETWIEWSIALALKVKDIRKQVRQVDLFVHAIEQKNDICQVKSKGFLRRKCQSSPLGKCAAGNDGQADNLVHFFGRQFFYGMMQLILMILKGDREEEIL